MKEIFKDIPEYEGYYQVSNLGNVKSIRFKNERILKQNLIGPERKKYYAVGLCVDYKQKTIKVHHLVALVFLSHKTDGTNRLVVNHKDNDVSNNRLDNLNIISNRKNCYSHHKSTSIFKGVSWVKRRKKWESQIYINGSIKFLGYFKNELDASFAYQSELKNL